MQMGPIRSGTSRTFLGFTDVTPFFPFTVQARSSRQTSVTTRPIDGQVDWVREKLGEADKVVMWVGFYRLLSHREHITGG